MQYCLITCLLAVSIGSVLGCVPDVQINGEQYNEHKSTICKGPILFKNLLPAIDANDFEQHCAIPCEMDESCKAINVYKEGNSYYCDGLSKIDSTEQLSTYYCYYPMSAIIGGPIMAMTTTTHAPNHLEACPNLDSVALQPIEIPSPTTSTSAPTTTTTTAPTTTTVPGTHINGKDFLEHEKTLCDGPKPDLFDELLPVVDAHNFEIACADPCRAHECKAISVYKKGYYHYCAGLSAISSVSVDGSAVCYYPENAQIGGTVPTVKIDGEKYEKHEGTFCTGLPLSQDPLPPNDTKNYAKICAASCKKNDDCKAFNVIKEGNNYYCSGLRSSKGSTPSSTSVCYLPYVAPTTPDVVCFGEKDQPPCYKPHPGGCNGKELVNFNVDTTSRAEALQFCQIECEGNSKCTAMEIHFRTEDGKQTFSCMTFEKTTDAVTSDIPKLCYIKRVQIR